MASVNVEIVRPKRTGREVIGVLIGGIVNLALAAYVVMTLAPVFSPWDPSYWQAFTLVMTIRVVIGDQSAHTFWTKDAK